jgi:hypothetical protein
LSRGTGGQSAKRGEICGAFISDADCYGYGYPSYGYGYGYPSYGYGYGYPSYS